MELKPLCPVCFKVRIMRKDQKTCSRDCMMEWNRFVPAQKEARLKQASKGLVEVLDAIHNLDVDGVLDRAAMEDKLNHEQDDEMPEFLKKSLASENRTDDTKK